MLVFFIGSHGEYVGKFSTFLRVQTSIYAEFMRSLMFWSMLGGGLSEALGWEWFLFSCHDFLD